MNASGSPPEGDRAKAGRLVVILASAGRPDLLGEAIRSCAAQRDARFTGIVSVPDEQSLPADRSVLAGWQVVTGSRGLAAQRNAALDTLDPGVEVVAFFDDDSVARADYLCNAVRFLDEHPAVMGLTGRVLLDGVRSGEISPQAATAVLDRSSRETNTPGWRPARTLYGCNFVVRRVGDIPRMRFDERLPLYSWLEDHDFARRLMRFGPLAKVDSCVIVHRAAGSGGRRSHLRLGYSQVMNPVYLAGKGSFPAWLATQQIVRPVSKNLALSFVGATTEWRRTRLLGNLTAAGDILRGRITPERIVGL